MFPLSALLSHAELKRPRSPHATAVEARRAERITRHGNLTLYPCDVSKSLVSTPATERPRVVASISNVSTSGVGLISDEPIEAGTQFDIDWSHGPFTRHLRFVAVHSKPTQAGMYRTGARLIAGVMPAEPVSSQLDRLEPEADEPILRLVDESPVEMTTEPVMTGIPDDDTADDDAANGGTMKMNLTRGPAPTIEATAAPAGTFSSSSALGFEKTESLDGVTTCGWQRSIQIRRDGGRLWVYIHSPGKKNGWGIYVDAEQFAAAHDRVARSAESPFIATMAA